MLEAHHRKNGFPTYIYGPEVQSRLMSVAVCAATCICRVRDYTEMGIYFTYFNIRTLLDSMKTVCQFGADYLESLEQTRKV